MHVKWMYNVLDVQRLYKNIIYYYDNNIIIIPKIVVQKGEPVEAMYDDEGVPVMINNNYNCSFIPVASIPVSMDIEGAELFCNTLRDDVQSFVFS